MLDFNQLFQYSRRVLEDIRLRFHSLLSGDSNLPYDHDLIKNEQEAEHSPKRVKELLQFFELYLLDPNQQSDRAECLIRNEFAIQKHSNELSELKKEFGECEKIIAELSGKYTDLVNKEQQIIAKLECDIRDTKRKKITMKNEISEKIGSANENNRKSVGNKRRILSERLEENEKEVWKQIRDNYEKENSLSQKNQKLRSEIKIWIDRYDNEMSKNQKIIDAIEKNFEEISAERKIVDRDNDYYESKYLALIDRKNEDLKIQKGIEEDISNKKMSATLIQAATRHLIVKRKFKMNKIKSGKQKKMTKNS